MIIASIPMATLLHDGYRRVIKQMILVGPDPLKLMVVLPKLQLPLKLQFALALMYPNATACVIAPPPLRRSPYSPTPTHLLLSRLIRDVCGPLLSHFEKVPHSKAMTSAHD